MVWPVWVVAAIVSIIISAVSYLLMPKPKQPKPEAARELENPTAEAGRPIPVLFGTITMKGPNILHVSDKKIRNYKVKA